MIKKLDLGVGFPKHAASIRKVQANRQNALIPSVRLCSANMRMSMTVLGVVALCLGFLACHHVSGGKNNAPAIVGTWFVKAPEAPFQYHMFIFNSDGPSLRWLCV
jgi:hypothetical protein